MTGCGSEHPESGAFHRESGTGRVEEHAHSRGVTASADSRYIAVALGLIVGFLVFEVAMAFAGHSLGAAGRRRAHAGRRGRPGRRPTRLRRAAGHPGRPALMNAAAGSRPGLHRQAVRLEQFSIAWMLIEAGVAVTAGVIAGSLALTSFGFDSVIELVSAVLVLRRLRAGLAGGEPDEPADRRVLRIIAVTFYALAAYVIIGSVIDLVTSAHPESSPVGIVLTISSLLVMPLLGWRKRHVGTLLGNPLVQADAAETILCATLAATTLLGLVLFTALGWWWADPIAALAVAYFAVREGREAWHGELLCDD